MSKIIDLDQIEDQIAAGKTFQEMQVLKSGAAARIAGQTVLAQQEGFAAGQRQGHAEVLGRAEQILERFKADLDSKEVMLVDVVLRALASIIADMPPVERVKSIVKRAIEDVVDTSNIRIKVPPEDVGQVNEAVNLIASETKGVAFSVINDPLLQKGEMQLMTPLGAMHIGQDRQIGRLEAALRRGAQAL